MLYIHNIERKDGEIAAGNLVVHALSKIKMFNIDNVSRKRHRAN
jgi:hypothetical protein